MKKVKIFFLFLVVSLTACTTIDTPTNPNNNTIPVIPTTPVVPTNPEVTTPTEPDDGSYTVTIKFNNRPFNEAMRDEEDKIAAGEINAVWVNDTSKVTAPIMEDSTAKSAELTGEYHVYIDKIPEGYTYNPNDNVVNDENRHIDIVLKQINRTTGKGDKLYNEISISNQGFYRTNVSSRTNKVYYEYRPKEPGYYIIESHVNVYEDSVTPKMNFHTGSVSWKNPTPEVCPGESSNLGRYEQGGYTRNFRKVIRISKEELSGVFTFAIYAENKTNTYPISIDWSITFADNYVVESTTSSERLPLDSLIQTPESGEQLNLDLRLSATDVVRYRFATYDTMYFDFNIYDPYKEKDFKYYRELSNYIDDETITMIDNTYSGTVDHEITPDTVSEYIERITIDYEIKFNSNNTGTISYLVKQTKYAAASAGTILEEKVLDEDTISFTYTLDAVKKSYRLINADGGTGSYYDSGKTNSPNRTGNLVKYDGSKFKYDESCGYYRYYDAETDTFGPYVCAYITQACPFYDPTEGALSAIQLRGNKALTVLNLYNGKWENHSKFIERDYAGICNSDGLCFVTKELRDFLYFFSDGQRLFMDGNGFVEYAGVYAIEEDQWLFACAYYQAE